ncbi:MAG: biopolymer transporter ExbD [Desulfobacteraceae bacterium]|jgi:biopolymer transport protein ExbD
MRRWQSLKEPAVGLNMTPLIDMVFILLVFFVVNTSFVKETGVEIQRPSAKSAVKQEQATILIAVNHQGEIWIDKQRVDLRALRGHIERLHAESPEGSVVVLADNASETGVVMQVVDQARLAGIAKVAVAATKQ